MHPVLTSDSYWTNEFKMFYDPKTGLDIDGAWIDMNEPSSVSLDLIVFWRTLIHSMHLLVLQLSLHGSIRTG